MATKPLSSLLNPSNNGDLSDIVRRARELGELTDTLAGALPDEFAGAIIAANVRENGELIVIAASSAWASRLRYEAEGLLRSANAAGASASSCRIRVTQS